MAALRPASSLASVPFVDLSRVHAGLRDEVLEEIGGLIDTGAFTNGPQVGVFESAFAGYCGTATCVGLASGLDALRLGLLAAGLGAGDEVLVPANTFVATFEAISQAGATPVPVDVSPADYNLDIGALAAAIGPRTRAILPVHLYGQLADMRVISSLARKHGLAVVEDACQAHGATRDGVVAGAAGLAGAFSFYPGKNLGAFGDAGALVTDDLELAARVRALREHGQREKYRHDVEGWTARLDTIQALVLLAKLPLLDAWNEDRRRAAEAYSETLGGVGDLRLPPVPEGSNPVWHLYVVATREREALASFLGARGIATGRHYPEPAHLTAAYASLGHPAGSFPVTERLSAELLSLPIFPGMREDEIETVSSAIQDFFGDA